MSTVSHWGYGLVFGLLLVGALSASADIGKRYIASNVAGVHSEPDAKTPFATLGLNSEVSLLEVKGDWARVSVTGWVRRGSLSDRPVSETREQDTDSSAGRGFSYRNVAFLPFTDGIAKCVGEVTNRSGGNYESVFFKLSVYNRGGNLLNTADILVENFNHGETRSFDTYVYAELSDISTYRLQFESSYP